MNPVGKVNHGSGGVLAWGCKSALLLGNLGFFDGPRNGKRVDSRPTIERKTQQGGPVRSRKGRGRNDSPYIEERTRSNNRNARQGGDQQRQDQERKGACTRKSISLEVLVGNANYKI
ncbi:uncharacterized protein TNCV_4374221 [Trichonephila clavipes]|uniref:Uncharacterized protein n=1 Tax=Trichonephila clavipes TaxID=2585209 RepID=A0A8X6RE81_TRICX|nr:uncharacterized protein TNCV_4374221 [Trichonephila clavipes]